MKKHDREMSLYSRYIFPRLMDQALSRPGFIELRRQLLSGVYGSVLEIGCGTGLNLPHYPTQIKGLSVIEPNQSMRPWQQARAAESEIQLDHKKLTSDYTFDLPDDYYDCVVSTWVLCSVPDLALALSEICRVLKPDGKFFFIEHGRAPSDAISIWQSRLNVFSKVIGCGCHLDRNPFENLLKASMSLEKAEKFYLAGVSKLGGYTYFGIARKYK